jgi:hypothetical protein
VAFGGARLSGVFRKASKRILSNNIKSYLTEDRSSISFSHYPIYFNCKTWTTRKASNLLLDFVTKLCQNSSNIVSYKESTWAGSRDVRPTTNVHLLVG